MNPSSAPIDELLDVVMFIFCAKPMLIFGITYFYKHFDFWVRRVGSYIIVGSLFTLILFCCNDSISIEFSEKKTEIQQRDIREKNEEYKSYDLIHEAIIGNSIEFSEKKTEIQQRDIREKSEEYKSYDLIHEAIIGNKKEEGWFDNECIGPYKKNCNGICVNIESDINNCGECGQKCESDSKFCQNVFCDKWQCTKTCAGRLCLCGPICADLDVDIGNCGACGNSCRSKERCHSGKCISIKENFSPD